MQTKVKTLEKKAYKDNLSTRMGQTSSILEVDYHATQYSIRQFNTEEKQQAKSSHLTKVERNPTTHRANASPLLPVNNKTTGGVVYMPLPTMVLMMREATSCELRSRGLSSCNLLRTSSVGVSTSEEFLADSCDEEAPTDWAAVAASLTGSAILLSPPSVDLLTVSISRDSACRSAPSARGSRLLIPSLRGLVLFRWFLLLEAGARWSSTSIIDELRRIFHERTIRRTHFIFIFWGVGA
jgi:hypothetical protein